MVYMAPSKSAKVASTAYKSNPALSELDETQHHLLSVSRVGQALTFTLRDFVVLSCSPFDRLRVSG